MKTEALGKHPVVVTMTPIEDPKRELSSIYERLARILTLKLEIVLLPQAIRSTFAGRLGELIVEESRLIEDAKRLQATSSKRERASRASVAYFPPQKRF